jgi:hypothetical protein
MLFIALMGLAFGCQLYKTNKNNTMTRKVFYSFHYDADAWRASKIRNIGAIEDNAPASDNDWETITDGGDSAIEDWIKGQMKGRTCAVLLIGQGTAGRKWINYEIVQAWSRGMGLLGIHIHNITNYAGDQCKQGKNPFDGFNIDGVPLSNIVKTYNPSYSISKNVRNHIEENLSDWIEVAIKIRAKY